MNGTSARRAAPRRGLSVSLGLILAGLGAALFLASLYLEYAGPAIWRGSLAPERSEGSHGIYATPELELPSGTYTMHLRYRKPPRVLEISTGYYGVEVTCEAHPEWQASGSLKRRKMKARRPTVSGTVVLHIVRPLHAPLLLDVEGTGDATLSVTVRKARLDYRIPLVFGLVLAVVGLLVDPAARSRIAALMGRG